MFIMLVGIAGSGKSTFAQEMVIKHPDIVWLSSDNIREELYGDANIQTNPKKVFDIMNDRARDFLNNDKDVIYDATNLNAKNRAQTLAQFDKRYHKYVCIVFTTAPQECIERQSLRERKVPEEVILRQSRQYQTPTKEEGWDVIEFI